MLRGRHVTKYPLTMASGTCGGCKNLKRQLIDGKPITSGACKYSRSPYKRQCEKACRHYEGIEEENR